MGKPFKRSIPDPEARRYFVYTLTDADGDPVYVGRSCNVGERIRAHYSETENPYTAAGKAKAIWLPDVRSVSMVGPFTWDEAVKEEGRQIRSKRPRGNRTHMRSFEVSA
jgi:predicted GIY-YIG superfamily endonuclease